MSTPKTQIQSVARAVRLLSFVAEHPTGCSVGVLADAIGTTRPTTHHLLNTLVAEGMLSKQASRRYVLGPRVGLFAEAFQRTNVVPDDLVEPLHRLAAQTGETAYLTAWRAGRVRVLGVVEGIHAVRVSGLHVGFEDDAHSRPSGKLLLALAPPDVCEQYLREHPLTARTGKTITDPDEFARELERIRQDGFAVDDEEFTEGVGCISAPIYDGQSVIGVYTASAPIERMRAHQRELTGAVLFTARSASRVGDHEQRQSSTA